MIDAGLMTQDHKGNNSLRINFFDIFGYTEPVNVQSATIATTGNTDTYFLAPRDLIISAVYVSGADTLATSDTNYITFSAVNLGQAGSGTANLLSTADTNTTKTTGGSALTAGTKRTFVISTTPANLTVNQGDRIRIRAAATGTLANTVTFPVYLLVFNTI